MAMEQSQPYMHEDDLPKDITDAEYDAWYAKSWIPDGVGCRVGPVFVRAEVAESLAAMRASQTVAECTYCGDEHKDYAEEKRCLVEQINSYVREVVGARNVSQMYKSQLAAKDAEIAALKAEYRLPPLNETVRYILGKLCFQLVDIARVLRASGQHVATKAEDEQACAIYFLLTKYVENGVKWESVANSELRAMLDAARAEQEK